ncbi:hypothetical protein ALP36_02386 [Pseudomonas syringae pv. coriandricola]|uniref:Uncharacterized protein n=1 Tax=Pseudomonas syringae pv. coriandricola TaxID=264453 RepID=A0A3M5RDP0_9PSED|nr:hypothetical protein [Pseudomonas syringae group genomosp. 3]RMU07171.1 hypothetical protein ALP36_02386 [Pseudomonas syringae pv. coriandricola]
MAKKAIGNIDDIFKQMHVNRTQQFPIVEKENVIAQPTPEKPNRAYKELKLRPNAKHEEVALFEQCIELGADIELNAQLYSCLLYYFLTEEIKKLEIIRENAKIAEEYKKSKGVE